MSVVGYPRELRSSLWIWYSQTPSEGKWLPAAILYGTVEENEKWWKSKGWLTMISEDQMPPTIRPKEHVLQSLKSIDPFSQGEYNGV